MKKNKIQPAYFYAVGMLLVVVGGLAFTNGARAAHTAATQPNLAACVECHGENGMKTANGAPFLAGQNANYMAAAMRAYAKGHRHHERMEAAAKALSEPEILAFAQHYAEQTGTWKGAASSDRNALAAPSPETVAAGRNSAKPCLSCHGPEGNSTRGGVPSIAGLPPSYFVHATRAYFTGERADALMATFKDALDDRELNQLAAYFATLTRQKSRPATAGNVAAGKNAASACAGCHGRDGNSNVAEFPSITGLDPDYFVKAMREYRDGKRKNAHMRKAADNLSDATITNLAAYFATREPKASGASFFAARTAKFDPATDGERAVQACVGCHGDAKTPPQNGTPRLTGLSPRYLVASMTAYRDGARRHDLMKTFVANLSELDIENIAFHLSSQRPAVVNSDTAAIGAADVEAARPCAACHGDGGNSMNPAVPSLSGQDPTYLARAIEAYKSGARAHDDMRKAVAALSAESTEKLARYFNRQSPVVLPVRAPEPPEVIAARCDRCHGERGYTKENGKPRLAGQSEIYLLKALREYKHEQRKNSAMHAMSDVLSEIEMRAIAAYYARN